MTPWNLGLRFLCELAAIAGLAAGAVALTSGPIRWVAVVAGPVLAATAWGLFNVPSDPSRSGRAPVTVAGWVRLAVETVVLGAGVAGFVVAGWPSAAAILVVAIVVHYASSTNRLRWLLGT
jgi:hypothetical protein